MKKLFSAILVLFLCFMLLPASVSAETMDVYVSSTGSDENSGTAEAPFATLTKAIEAVPDHGTIHVVGTVKDAGVTSITCAKRGYTITITGDTLDFSGLTHVILGDAVTFQEITIAASSETGSEVRIYANGYKLVMGDGITTTGNVEIFGGGRWAKVASTDVTVLSGTYKAIYGGGNASATAADGVSKVTGDVNLFVGGTTNSTIDDSSHSYTHLIFGGGRYDSPVGGNVNLTFTGNAKANYVFGGGRGGVENDVIYENAGVAGKVRTVISGGTAVGLYGSGYYCGKNPDVELIITGGTFEQVFGGSQMASQDGDVTLSILGGTISRRVYGGCYNDWALTYDSNYVVNGTITLYVGSGANLALNEDSDNAFTANSRVASSYATAENTVMAFESQTVYDANKGKFNALSGYQAADKTHIYTFSASGATITGTCSCTDCNGAAMTATLNVGSKYPYARKAITPATVSLSENWTVGTPIITYANNVAVGTATASMAMGNTQVSVNFTIEPVYYRSLSLGESIAINFKANRDFLTDNDLEKVEFYMDGVVVHTITGIPAGAGELAAFSFNKLTPAQMGKEVTARFCFADGTYEEKTTSVLDYALSNLSANGNEMDRLLVDMLNYGAATQTYVGDTGTFVNAELTEEQKSFGTAEAPQLTSHLAFTDLPEGGQELATWQSAGLNLKDSVTVRLKFTAENAQNLVLKITCGGYEWKITDFTASGSAYYAYFSGLNPAQLRLPFQAAFYDAEGNQVSKILQYSVETYAKMVKDQANATLTSLTDALMCYSDSVSAWVGSSGVVASVTADGKTTYYETIEDAITYANAATTKAQITLFKDVTLSETPDLTNDITIVNASGQEITISRGADNFNMFRVYGGGSLTLGTNDTNWGGTLTVDGTSASPIGYRIVRVAGGTTFTLGKNATLTNGTGTAIGGAVYTAGTANIYGTITGNTSTANGGGLYVDATGTANIYGTISGNESTKNGGGVYVLGTAEIYGSISNNASSDAGAGLCVADGANVTSSGATFSENDSTGNDRNAGAVYVAAGGTYTDTGSNYTGNKARNGGAIFLGGDGANVTLSGTGTFTNNAAVTANGGAIYVNGGTLTLNGYTFEGNTAKTNADSAIHVAKGAATIEGITFQGGTEQKLYVVTSLTFTDLTDVTVVQANAGATLTLSGDAGTNVQLKPYSYTDDTVVITAESSMDLSTVAVTPVGDGSYWIIDENGVLQNYPVASIGETNYYTLTEALAAAKDSGAAAQIVMLRSVTLVEAVEITTDVTIVNAPGETITISRSNLAADMFTVADGGSLTLGTNDAAETGKLILDGASASAIGYRTATVAANATFTLGKNAVLQNANSKQPGGALHVTGTAYIYGAISNNKSTSTGAGLCTATGATVTANGATFSGNDSRINATVSNGGAIYVAANSTFTDTNSTYTDNKGKNGGAIFLGGAGANVTLNGTDATKALFSGNIATGDRSSRGGAIFVNNGGTLKVSGYTFEGNTSTGTNANTGNGAIQVVTGSATLSNLTFQGEEEQLVYINDALTFQNLTGAKIVEMKAAATITLSGAAGTNVQLKPYAYTAGTQVIAGEGVDFSAVSVTPNGDKNWFIDAEGKLQSGVVSVTMDDATVYYDTFAEALAAANEAETSAQLLLLEDIILTETAVISKDITILSKPGAEVTVSRGDFNTDMFNVTGGSLTLGTSDANETGKLILDGASDSAVAGRTVTVNSGATFTLNKNATLRNANSTAEGGALNTAGMTYLYGSISNNKGKNGAGLNVQATATVTCYEATFSGNQSVSITNGGAIYVAGTFTDTNSTYSGNKAKNGGAIFLGTSTANVELIGTDTTKALFSGNIATGDTSSRGGAIFVNSGGTLKVSGYTFEGNTSTGTNANTGNGAIQVVTGSATLSNLTFQGEEEQLVYINDALTFQNLTGAKIVEMKAAATITLSGAAGTNVQLKPYAYTEGTAVIAGENVDFTAVAVTQKGDGSHWSIDSNGKLKMAAAVLTADGATECFDTLEAAVAEANSAETAQITLWKDVTLTETVAVTGNITIVNASGQEITISRGELTADMFNVTGGSLTLGTGNADETGKLILDGASDSAVAGRTVFVSADAAFTLEKNAVLQGANSSSAGAALRTASVNTVIYGTICNNTSSVDCGGLYVEANGKATINGATFGGNKSTGATGAALYVAKNAMALCENAVFSDNNTATPDKNGGAVYCAGTFEDKGSSYTGNKARNGGAIFIPAGGVVTLSANGAAKTTFTDNAVNVNGGAIYVNGGTLNISGCTFTGNTTCLKDATKTIKTIYRASGTINYGEDVIIDGVTTTE